MYLKFIFETVFGMPVLFVAFGAIGNLVHEYMIALWSIRADTDGIQFRYELN